MRRLALAISLVCLVATAPARAASPEDRARARALAEQGAQAYERGDYPAALARYEEAEALVPVVTIALEKGRTLEKLGRWVDALDVLRAAATAPLGAAPHPSHKKARAEAEKLANDLDVRVPRVAIDVRPVRPDTAVTIDDEPVPTESLGGIALRVDPGPHTVTARATDGSSATRQLELAPGDRRELRMLLELPRPKTPPPSAAAPVDDTQRTAGWIALGVGGAFFVAGSAVGVAAVVQRGDLADACPDDRCPARLAGDVSTLDALRATTTLGWIVGLAGIGAGVTLIVTAPDADASEGTPAGTTVEAHVGPGWIGVGGTF